MKQIISNTSFVLVLSSIAAVISCSYLSKNTLPGLFTYAVAIIILIISILISGISYKLDAGIKYNASLGSMTIGLTVTQIIILLLVLIRGATIELKNFISKCGGYLHSSANSMENYKYLNTSVGNSDWALAGATCTFASYIILGQVVIMVFMFFSQSSLLKKLIANTNKEKSSEWGDEEEENMFDESDF